MDSEKYTLIKEMTGTYNQSPYKWLFQKYMADCEIFVETGTYLGDSVRAAFELGYKRVLSVEADASLHAQAKARLSDLPEHQLKNLHLFFGDSGNKMQEMMSLVDSRALFWIDAHTTNGDPAFVELEFIKQHPIKNHIIIVDDIPLYFGDGTSLQKVIRTINPDYKFTFETFPPRGPGYHMVAHF